MPGRQSSTLGAHLATVRNPAPAEDAFADVLAGLGEYLLVSAKEAEDWKGVVYLFDAVPSSSTFGERLLTINNPLPDSYYFGRALAACGDRFSVAATTALGEEVVYLFELREP